MVYYLITVHNGVFQKIEWFENEDLAKETYEETKQKSTENDHIKLEEINGLNKNNKVEIFIKGGWVRNVTPLKHRSKSNNKDDSNIIVVTYN